MLTTALEKIVTKPRLLFRPDPVLGWGLTPDHGVRVGFREGIVQHIGPDGTRYVPGALEAKGPAVAIYGCSFTYGTGLSDEETYCALLQRAVPGARILNHGIGGHGTVQNYLRLRRDITSGAVDAAIFAIISDHRFRNIAHPQRMHQYLKREWYELGVEHVPIARMDAAGNAHVTHVPIWQPMIKREDLSLFLPDDYMINSATLAVLQLVRDLAERARIPLCFALLDSLDPCFSAAVTDRYGDTVDVSTPYDQDHTFLPHDIHPNAHANALFAERLTPVVGSLINQVKA